MKKEEASEVLFEIMRKLRSGVTLIETDFEKGIDVPLTGDYWKFDAVQMVYLFCEVEKAFHIRIQPKHLVNYQFNTLRQIINLVVNYCQQAVNKKEAST